MAELVFFSGTMDCGKSTLALQIDHNHRARGRQGLIFSKNDRGGESVLSSRLGLETASIEVVDGMSLWAEVARQRIGSGPVDYVVCDEAQFYSVTQIEDLAAVVDEMNVDVYAFGITSDFRTRLFPGSQRLIELADRVEVLQVQALCWCGARATHNARTIGGVMVLEGDQVVVGDVGPQAEVGYETLCRRHHRRRMSAAAARAGGTPATLPLDLSLELPLDLPAPASPRGAHTAMQGEPDVCRIRPTET
ncbi:thymidine kinase [Micrococcales bacterium 31B]|nr:thymidine kinase [Micrococcales bacterium 31B]